MLQTKVVDNYISYKKLSERISPYEEVELEGSKDLPFWNITMRRNGNVFSL